MKKLFIVLFAAGLLISCNSKKVEPQPLTPAPVVLEADVEAALEKNIELNQQITELDAELETIINEQ